MAAATGRRPGRLSAGDRRPRLVGLHRRRWDRCRVGERPALRDRQDRRPCPTPSCMSKAATRTPTPCATRRGSSTRSASARSAASSPTTPTQLDDQRGPLGDGGLEADPRRAFHRQHRRERRGPALNPHPVTQGIENLCNPPGRGLGPMDTTNTGYRLADAFLWTHPPGNSSGCGGGRPAGTFWPARAIGLAARANAARLGPRLPSRPYSDRAAAAAPRRRSPARRRAWPARPRRAPSRQPAAVGEQPAHLRGEAGGRQLAVGDHHRRAGRSKKRAFAVWWSAAAYG